MHELGQTGRVVAQLLERAGDRRVTWVKIGIPPDLPAETMEFAWQHAARGTPAEYAVVRWVETHHVLRCWACLETYRGKELDPCPACGGDGLAVERTSACDLLDFELEGTDVPR